MLLPKRLLSKAVFDKESGLKATIGCCSVVASSSTAEKNIVHLGDRQNLVIDYLDVPRKKLNKEPVHDLESDL